MALKLWNLKRELTESGIKMVLKLKLGVRSCSLIVLFLLDSFVFLFTKVLTCTQPDILKIRKCTKVTFLPPGSNHCLHFSVCYIFFLVWMHTDIIYVYIYTHIYILTYTCMWKCVCLCTSSMLSHIFTKQYFTDICCRQTYVYILFISFHLWLYFFPVFCSLHVP